MKGLFPRLGRRAFREIFRLLLPVRRDIKLEKLGSEYGGWYVPPSLIEPDWVCYCAGVGEDITFDLELVSRFECEVHAFDPTPRAIAHVDRLVTAAQFHFHPVGVWCREETLRFYAPHNPASVSHSVKKLRHSNEYFEARCWSVPQLMEQLGNDAIDLLKLDIEGAEVEVIANILDEGIRPKVICVEFDQLVGLAKSVRRLLGSGYDITYIDRWNYSFVNQDR